MLLCLQFQVFVNRVSLSIANTCRKMTVIKTDTTLLFAQPKYC